VSEQSGNRWKQGIGAAMYVVLSKNTTGIGARRL
jgi:hypothetical protein